MKLRIEVNLEGVVETSESLGENEIKKKEGALNERVKELYDEFIQKELKGEGEIGSQIVTITPYEEGVI